MCNPGYFVEFMLLRYGTHHGNNGHRDGGNDDAESLYLRVLLFVLALLLQQPLGLLTTLRGALVPYDPLGLT